MGSGFYALFLYSETINTSSFIFFQDCYYFVVLYSDIILVFGGEGEYGMR